MNRPYYRAKNKKPLALENNSILPRKLEKHFPRGIKVYEKH